MDKRLDSMDRRLDSMDKRLDSMEDQIRAIDPKWEQVIDVHERLAALEAKLEKR